MAYPKKRRGFRTVTVGADRFRWRLQAGTPDSSLVIQGPESSGQELLVTLRGWQDPWFAISGVRVEGRHLYLETAAHNEPSIITPRFVRRAILFGLAHGWDPSRATAPFRVTYADTTFSSG